WLAPVSMLGARCIAAVALSSAGSLRESKGVSNVYRTGDGVYFVTLSAALTVSSFFAASLHVTTSGSIAVTLDSATQATVRTWDADGVAANLASWVGLLDVTWD